MEQWGLNATQEIAKHTKKTAELLKDGVGSVTMRSSRVLSKYKPTVDILTISH